MKLTVERYLDMATFEQAAIDSALGAQQTQRKLLFVTLHGAQGVDLSRFKKATTRSFLPWLDHHVGVQRHFGCIIFGAAHPHAHLVIDAERQLRRASDFWAANHPPTARTWANTTYRGLHIELFRLPNEVRLRKGHPLVDVRALPNIPARHGLESAIVGSSRYLAQQMPCSQTPIGQKYWFESENFSSIFDYRATRDQLVDCWRKSTFLPEHLEAETLAATHGRRTSVRSRVVPSYTHADRRAFSRGRAAVLAQLGVTDLLSKKGLPPIQDAPTDQKGVA